MGEEMSDRGQVVGAVAYGKQSMAPAEDGWAHRSAKMRCDGCMWFIYKVGGVPAARDRVIGRCRRHAPTTSGFPVVFSGDWCGDHKIDETKST